MLRAVGRHHQHSPPPLSPRDEEIQSKCGIDATTYLSFQRHLLVLLMLVCVLSVAVILPVNFSGDLLGRCTPVLGWLRSVAQGQGAEGPSISCGAEEKAASLLGSWEVGGEERRGATGTVCPASTEMRCALASRNLLHVLFPCRTQPHALRPDNHRQHPDTVCGSRVREHRPVMGNGLCEQQGMPGRPCVCVHCPQPGCAAWCPALAAGSGRPGWVAGVATGEVLSTRLVPVLQRELISASPPPGTVSCGCTASLPSSISSSPSSAWLTTPSTWNTERTRR